MKGRKGQDLSSVIIGIIIFGLFVSGFWFSYADTAQNYNMSINESFAEPFDRTLEAKNITTQISENIQDTEATTTDQIVTFISGGVAILKIIFTSIGIITPLSGLLGSYFAVPAFFGVAFLTIAIFWIGWKIAQALLNR